MSTWFERLATSRPPDSVIGGKENPYMLRWYVIPRNKILNIYLHRFLRSDDDRALHDHPWLFNISRILKNAYTEHTIAYGGVHNRTVYQKGNTRLRGAKFAHRIELHDGECWSLFITGPVIQKWGFHCPGGWRAWEMYSSPHDKGQIGRGCE